MLSAIHHGWETKKIFHSRLPKTVSNSISFTILSYWKPSDVNLVPEDFYKKKNCIKELCKNFLLKLCGIPHTRRKGLSMLL